MVRFGKLFRQSYSKPPPTSSDFRLASRDELRKINAEETVTEHRNRLAREHYGMSYRELSMDRKQFISNKVKGFRKNVWVRRG